MGTLVAQKEHPPPFFGILVRRCFCGKATRCYPEMAIAFCSAGVSKLTVQQLMKELYNKVAIKWNPIGTFLGIPEEELSTISQREHGDPQGCLMAMLRAWLH